MQEPRSCHAVPTLIVKTYWHNFSNEKLIFNTAYTLEWPLRMVHFHWLTVGV